MGMGMFFMQRKVAQFDSLQAKLAKAMSDLVDAKLASHTLPLQSDILNLRTEIRELQDRLELGNGRFEKLGENDQNAAIKLERIVGDFKTFMLEKFATKDDLQKHEQSVKGSLDKVPGRIERTRKKSRRPGQ